LRGLTARRPADVTDSGRRTKHFHIRLVEFHGACGQLATVLRQAIVILLKRLKKMAAQLSTTLRSSAFRITDLVRARHNNAKCTAGIWNCVSWGNDMGGTPKTDDLDNKVFILGVGAQRTGTSWLYHYLSSRPCVYMSEIKEIHYFNGLWNETHRLHAFNSFSSALKRVTGGVYPPGLPMPPVGPPVQALVDRLAMFDGGDQAYIDYFCRRVAPHHTHFGEITPAYSLLPVESFRHIRSLFANIRVIFFMRDPVHRIVSAMQQTTNQALLAVLRNPIMVERTRYDVTINNLRAVFPPECLFFGFYETLFCDASIRSLCEFLGLPFKPGEYGQIINAGVRQPVSLTSDQIDAGRSVFADTYAFCRREFGDAVPASWHG